MGEYQTVDVDIASWVEAARADPTLFRDRQITEIVLAAIGISPHLHANLVLKGGAAMALAFKSQRVTGDVDFTCIAEPADIAETIVEELNNLLPRTAIKLGYPNILCRVQSVKKMPRPVNFQDHDFPALLLKVGSALRGGPDEKHFHQGRASRVLELEISFRDQVHAFQELHLSGAEVAVRVFTIHEIIAEKFRALMQQVPRNRHRRQDVFDIAYLVEKTKFTEDDKEIILRTLREKCRSRNIIPLQSSLDDPDIRHRAERDWNTLSLEISDLPKFSERFEIVRNLYLSLPWAD